MNSEVLRVGFVPEHFAAPLLKLAESEWVSQVLCADSGTKSFAAC